MLTLEDVAWVAEIAASVVRNSTLVRPPKEWRQIPSWWKMVGEDSVRQRVVGDSDLVEDAVRAVRVLEGLMDVPRLCCLGPHG